MVAGAVTDVGGVRSPSDLRYREALGIEHSDLGQCSAMTPERLSARDSPEVPVREEERDASRSTDHHRGHYV
jgi:hypothetical protein